MITFACTWFWWLFVILLNEGTWLYHYGIIETLKSKVVKERYAMEKRKIVRRIILAVLLVCAVFLIYSIVTDPLGEHDIMLALAVTAGFIALEQDKRKER